MNDNIIPLRRTSAIKEKAEVSFEQWTLKFGKRLVAILGSGVVLTALSTAYKALSTSGLERLLEWLPFFVAAIQFGVIFLAIVFASNLPQLAQDDEVIDEPTLVTSMAPHEERVMKASGYNRVKDWNQAKYFAVSVLHQFRNYWMALWIFWLCLYFTLAVLYVPHGMPQSASSWLQVAATFFNNCATLMFVFCYEVLSQDTITKTPGGHLKSTVTWPRWVAVLILFTVLEVIAVALGLEQPDPSGGQKGSIISTFNQISGVTAATTMALFVGRLDSKFLEGPGWFLVLLYLYCAIQPLFELLGSKDQWWILVLINVALFLKCLLYLYMTWLFQTGRLLFYFVRVRRLVHQAEGDFKDFISLLSTGTRT